MPTVKPISDLQRNITQIVEECRTTQQPIYLTKNGSATLVVMDAETFDREMELQNEVRDREMRVYKALMRGWEDVQAGRVRSIDQAFEDADRIRNKMNG